MPRDDIRGIPQDWPRGGETLVNGPNGWSVATPTSAPTPTPTDTSFERSMYGNAAHAMRRDDGGTDWPRVLELLLGGGDEWSRNHPEDARGPSQMRTPTPEQAGPPRHDIEVTIKKKMHKDEKGKINTDDPQGAAGPMLRPRKVSPASNY